MAGLRTLGNFILPLLPASGVTIKYGHAVSLVATGNDRCKLPTATGGPPTDDEAHCGFSLSPDTTGDADGTQQIDVDTGSPSIPAISSAAINAGQRVAPSGNDGRIGPNPAGRYQALNTVSGADMRVWVKKA